MGRSMPHLVNVHAELKERGIRVIGVADSLDTLNETPAMEAFRHMLGAVAQMGRQTIVENTRAGLAAAAKQGRFPGRPRANNDAIHRAIALRKAGATLKKIHEKTGLSIAYISMLANGRRTAT